MFKVLGWGGAEYGPVDLATLRKWARKRRIAPEMILLQMDTGRRFPAYQLPALQPIFSAQAEPPPVIAPRGASSRRRGALRALAVAAALAYLVLLSGYSLLAAGRSRIEGRILPVLRASAPPSPPATLKTLPEPEPARVEPPLGVTPDGWPYADGTLGSVRPVTARQEAAGWVPARRYSTDWERLSAYQRAGDVAGMARAETRQERRGRLLRVPPGAGARIVDHKVVYPYYLYKVRFTDGVHAGRTAWLGHHAFCPHIPSPGPFFP